MKILKYGMTGSLVSLLQLGLKRAGFYAGDTDGIFGPATLAALRRFQTSRGLTADGLAGPNTQNALAPFYLGYVKHTIRTGDTFFRLAEKYGTTIGAIETANPDTAPTRLRPGAALTVPLGFPLVPEGVDCSYQLISYIVRGLAARYPFLTLSSAGASVMGRPLLYLRAGSGENTVLYSAAHHANEWITAPALLLFAEELAAKYVSGGDIGGFSAGEIMEKSSVYLLPAVNPDGIDLVTGALDSGEYFRAAQSYARNYPAIPFPAGWKANIRGVDLNLQYPAGWEQARDIKFAQGYTLPGPRDYVGPAPLSEPESRAMYGLTLALEPSLVMALHTQGQVIYWRYLNYDVPGAEEIARRMGALSGYAVEDTPYASGFAGYKDWFIANYLRPGFTIEAGLGQNPLPIGQLPDIYAALAPMLAYGALAL